MSARQDVICQHALVLANNGSCLRAPGFVNVDCAFKCFEPAVFAGRKPE